MPIQKSLDFARVALYGGTPIDRATLNAKRKQINARAAALRRVSGPEVELPTGDERQMKIEWETPCPAKQ